MEFYRRTVILSFVLLTACSFAFPAVASASTYFVDSSTGSDSNNGTNPSTPWKTIAKVNAGTYHGGDSILFEGGQSFSGTIKLASSTNGGTYAPATGGTSANPITISSYGAGRATISSGSADGIDTLDIGGIVLENLIFVGSGNADVDGVSLGNEYPANGTIDYLYLYNLDVSLYGKNGVLVWGGYDAAGDDAAVAGFKNITIKNVVSHDNTNVDTNGGTAGINVAGDYGLAVNQPTFSNVLIDHCTAYNNTGIGGSTNGSGSGIAIGEIASGTVQYSIAYNNGGKSNASSNAVGISSFDSTNVVFQYNESYNNETAGINDGGGFDFDGGEKNSVMQYNYSHDNDGGGFELFEYFDPSYITANDGNIVRYNISQNDSRKNNSTNFQSSIFVGDGSAPAISDFQIYNNTIFSSIGTSSLINLNGSNINSYTGTVANNILYSGNGAYLVNTEGAKAASVLFRGNDYFATSTYNFKYNNSTFTSFAAWQATSSQEKISGVNVGATTNPLLQSPGGGETCGGYSTSCPSAYELQSTSPLIDAGLNLLSQFNINVGKQDFFGASIPQHSLFDVGAYEALYVAPATPSVSSGGGSMIWRSGPLAPGWVNTNPLSATATSMPNPVMSPAVNSQLTSTSPAAQLVAAPSHEGMTFAENRQLWDEGPDIKSLQQFLNAAGFGVSTTGPGSLGMETDFFGIGTYRALANFQRANNLPPTGFFGPLTRKVIVSLNH